MTKTPTTGNSRGLVIKRLETVYLYNFRYLYYIMNNILVQAPKSLNKCKAK
uniref:Uncharacterized protein n=2 Tax=Staphylococcus aureus TaxID=1280 RepID=A0A499S8F3_STAAU|nr:hypothetical protein D0Y80_m00045 [Staphylococcus aureus]